MSQYGIWIQSVSEAEGYGVGSLDSSEDFILDDGVVADVWEINVPSKTEFDIELRSTDNNGFAPVLLIVNVDNNQNIGDIETYGETWQAEVVVRREMDAGKYWLGILSANVEKREGKYDINVSCAHDDYHGDTRATAALVEIDETIKGQLHSGDEDWFQINLEEPGLLVAETTGSVDTFGALVNENGVVRHRDNDGGVDRNFRIEANLEAGSYFLSVRGFNTGNYRLFLLLAKPPETRTMLDSEGCADGRYIENSRSSSGLIGDCKALVAFFNGVIEAEEISNRALLSIGLWGRIGWEKIHYWKGITLREDRVRSIDLTDLGLRGEISKELGQLEKLQYLHLGFNNFSGEIPPELGQLEDLQELHLYNNQLTGRIPPELGLLTNLKRLNLDGNWRLYLEGKGLTGEIPSELGKLTNLTFLSLNTNQLSGEIPRELSQLTNLRSLWLQENRLSGEIPRDLVKLSNLLLLSLGGNNLTGTIPPELGQLVNLRNLWLGGNDLTGEIPPELGQLLNLRGLNLDNNKLAGNVPRELSALRNLQRLNLNGNTLTGIIPLEYGQLTNLQRLTLGATNLRGSIPFGLRDRLYELMVDSDSTTDFNINGSMIYGFGVPPKKQLSTNEVDARHHSISYYQGPLMLEWDWVGDHIEHQTLILGRWAVLVVRVDHYTQELPLVVTRVFDADNVLLAESLPKADYPTTEYVGNGLWRSEYIFDIPGELFRENNQIVHIIDRGSQLGELESKTIVIEGESPPKFRAVFIPLHQEGEDKNWHRDLDPMELMSGTHALLPIADDFDARIGTSLQIEKDDTVYPYNALGPLLDLWNKEAESDEFYHGIAYQSAYVSSGGRALTGGQVAVSGLSIGDIIPHEFGHNFGLSHTPGCYAQDTDEDYPYSEGGIGSEPLWSRFWRMFVSEKDNFTDVMSYCDSSRLTNMDEALSDYNYRKASEYWLNFKVQTRTEAVTQFHSDQTATPTQIEEFGSLAINGSIDTDGNWSIRQVVRSEKPPRAPVRTGNFTLILLNDKEVQIYSEPLTILRPSDNQGSESFWAVRVPLALRLSGEIRIVNSQGIEMLREPLPRMN